MEMLEQSRRPAGMTPFLLLMLTGFAGLPGLATAQQPSPAQTSAIRSSCRADYQAHCSSVPPGGQASLACLQQNSASLSPNCRQAVAAVGGGAPQSSTGSAPPAAGGSGRMAGRAAGGTLREECGADFTTHCRGVLPGGGRALACLADRRESLSHGCREALMPLGQGR
jgi:hypothetical protein